jgi:TRAP-type C4-dicarboxylate transport system substrate-binding protein
LSTRRWASPWCRADGCRVPSSATCRSWGDDSRQIDEALSSLAGTELAPDFEGLKLVNLFVDCSVLHTTSKPVAKLEDIRGLRIRVPSALGAQMVEAVGGIPVTMPQSDIYESLQRNVIDGAISPWDVIESLKLGEVLHQHTENVLFCGQLWFAFNERKFEGYPDAVKAAFEEIRGEYALNLAQDVYSRARESAKEFAKANDGEFHQFSDEDMATWKELTQPAVEAFLTENEAAVPNIREVKAALDAALEKHATE